jgi:ketosteroid isomerase-like protein
VVIEANGMNVMVLNRMKSATHHLLLLVLLFQAGSGIGQTFIGEEKEMVKILMSIKEFSKAVMASDQMAIGAAYTEDAKIFPNNREIISGRAAIIDYWTPKNGSRTLSHRLLPQEIKITGDEAYDYGYYEGISVSADGKESSWKGKYVVIWRKVGEDWKIYLDIWNRVPNE